MKHIPSLLIGSRDEAVDILNDCHVNGLLSILDPISPQLRNEKLAEDIQHLVFTDTSSEIDGGPTTDHVLEIIKFATKHRLSDLVVIHCFAGISRSPAAAIILLTVWTERPRAAARTVRALRPFASPNRSMIAIADSLLRLNGQLVHEVDACFPRPPSNAAANPAA